MDKQLHLNWTLRENSAKPLKVSCKFNRAASCKTLRDSQELITITVKSIALSKLKPNVLDPTASEDAQISAAIATNSDNPELVFVHLEDAQCAAVFFGSKKYTQVLAMKRAEDGKRE